MSSKTTRSTFPHSSGRNKGTEKFTLSKPAVSSSNRSKGRSRIPKKEIVEKFKRVFLSSP